MIVIKIKPAMYPGKRTQRLTLLECGHLKEREKKEIDAELFQTQQIPDSLLTPEESRA